MVLTVPAHLMCEFGQDCPVASFCGRCVGTTQGFLDDWFLSFFLHRFIIIIIIIIIITEIESSLGANSPYTSTDKINTNKYT